MIKRKIDMILYPSIKHFKSEIKEHNKFSMKRTQDVYVNGHNVYATKITEYPKRRN